MFVKSTDWSTHLHDESHDTRQEKGTNEGTQCVVEFRRYAKECHSIVIQRMHKKSRVRDVKNTEGVSVISGRALILGSTNQMVPTCIQCQKQYTMPR